MIHVGDCRDILPTLPAESVDSIVTDPPYGIGFMGKAWDRPDIQSRKERRAGFASHDPGAWSERGGHKSAAAAAGAYDLSPRAMRAFQDWTREWAAQALRVLKPGGWLLSFASPRTYHRMTCGIEDAGFEIRNQIMWIFGQGFPKSLNLCRCEPDVFATSGRRDAYGWQLCDACGGQFEAGTDLKPAHEPIAVARKPLAGTVKSNISAHGTGVLNIDGCRVPVETMAPNTGRGGMPRRHADEQRDGGTVAQPHDLGRWPANVIHDGSDEVLAAFPAAPGQIARARTDGDPQGNTVFGALNHVTRRPDPRGDSGSAARFFYCRKASRADRDDGCDALPLRAGGMVSNTSGQHITRRDGSAPGPARNNHPTVKPTELMRYLCRLVTPPGGLVLDPFAGSGSTGRGAVAEGMQFVGIEADPEYADIARRRIAAVQPGLALAAGGDR